jgi:hypothetical protein
VIVALNAFLASRGWTRLTPGRRARHA